MKSNKNILLILLLAIVGTPGCYERIDFDSQEEVRIPCVHCVLSPDRTQWLELGFLGKAGSFSHAGEEAEVCLIEEGGDGGPSATHLFEKAGVGLWRLDMAARPLKTYHLQIILSGTDTLTATTTMPDYDYDVIGGTDTAFRYSPGFEMRYDHHTDVVYVKDRDDEYRFTAMTDTRIYPDMPADEPWYFDSKEPYTPKYYRFDRPRFRLSEKVDGKSAIWCYKVGWSETDQAWYVEDRLATNLEDRIDGYNQTGENFSRSKTPETLSQFPEVSGMPLHYRYLRFPAGSLTPSDTIAISGDFSGPHYGDARPGAIILFELADKKSAEIMGQPYKDNIFTTGHAGYVNFKAVSEEYDRYLRDVAGAEILRDVSTDIIGIYGNTNTYSNIIGGAGVFGAEVDNKLYWSCGVWQY